ncbi:MAG TPA: NAD-dependent epimerase/dehydratase family protein [Acidobacteriaceae bacterium]|nr:NAD-dependent epimerase/dehydratase family protein [Acidobacteriaceae bacterium]
MTRKLLSRRVAVTGATGFIGMHLLRGLHAAGAEIVAIVAADKHIERLDSLPFSVQRVILGDASDMGGAIREAKAGYVIHLSAFVSTARSLEALGATLRDNLLATISLLTAAAELHADRVILMGSCEEYSQRSSPFDTAGATDPSSPYGASKAAATAYARMFSNSFGLSTVVLRPSVVYGPGQSERMLISQVMKAISQNRPVEVTAGEQTRDFIYVEDVVNAIIQSLTVPNVGRGVWNIGSGEVVTVRSCLERIERITGRAGLIEYGKRPYTENEIFQYELKDEETYATLDWKPSITLDAGLRKTWEFFRDKA